jgi:hypothetical protein
MLLYSIMYNTVIFIGNLPVRQYHARRALEGGSVNRCFQVGKVSRKVAEKSGGDADLSPRLVGICRKRAAIFPQPSFRDSPFLYPV